MKILTIIIPSYNTSKFIDKCLPTIIQAESNDLEILIINDGSTDDTAEKAQNYCIKYPAQVKMINKKNGGHGSAVNVGIEHAAGKYIRIIDGDDWVESNNLRKLINVLSGCDEDIIINPYYEVDQSKNYQKKIMKNNLPNGTYEFNQIIGKIKQFAIHNTTVKSSILKNLPQKFTEHCFYDDFEFYMFIVPYIKTMMILDYPVYDYLVGQKSQSVSNSSVLKNHLMMRQILIDSLIFYNNVQTDLEHREFMFNNLVTLCKSTFNVYLRNHYVKGAFENMRQYDEFLMKLDSELRNNVINNYSYISIALRNKAIFSLLGLALNFYKKSLR